MPDTLTIPSTGAHGVVCGAVLWRFRGELRLSVIVKATFQLDAGRYAKPVQAEALALRDRHRKNVPTNSLEQTSEIAPYKPRAEVMLSGHAYAPPEHPSAAVSARLAVFGDAPVIDKTLHVYGDRASTGAAPSPFRKMALVYERAVGGPGTGNPVGASPATGAAPNILDPKRPSEPAGFGPISRYWKTERRQPKPGVTRAAGFEIIEITDAFDWDFYLTAPEDQRAPFFRGDEWIVLDGMHPTLPRLQSRLPSAVAEARILRAGSGVVHALGPAQLVADTLVIQADFGRATLLWRGSVVVDRAESIASMALVAGVSFLGEPIAWPSEEAAHAPAPIEAAAPPGPASEPEEEPRPIAAADDDERTRMYVARPPPPPPRREATKILVVGEDLPAAALPFQPAAQAPIAIPPPHVAATPFVAPPQVIAPPQWTPPPQSPSAPQWTPPPQSPAPPQAGQPAPWDRPRVAPVAPPPPIEPQGKEPPKKRPPRDGATIPVTGPTSLVLATYPWQVKPPQNSLTIIIKGTFDIVHEAPAKLRAEGDFPIGDIHVDDDPEHSLLYASDFAVLKPKADVTLTGRAHAPRAAKKTPAMQVEFRFGEGKSGFARSITVFGDRRWEKKALLTLAPTEPEPFESIPLLYERAFGGPGVEANPVGQGYKGREGEDGIARLPNLEDPANLVRSPSDEPSPACFAPIPMTWRERWSKMGTYDKTWFRERWPYFPEDFDWTHFQSAPRAQQLDSLSGDERFSFTGMSPARPRVEGRLPGLRVRCFAQKTEEAGGDFQEIALRLDTAAFDAEQMKISLIWRGLLEVTDEEAPEIEAFYVMHEPQGAPKAPVAEARARYIAESAPKPIPMEDPDADREPERAAALAGDAPPGAPEEDVDPIEKAQMERLKAAGLTDEDIAGPVNAPDPPPPDPAAIAASLRAAGADEEEVREMLEALKPLHGEEGPPATPEEVRAKVLAMLHAGESFEGFDGEGSDLADLDFSGRSLAGANLRRASLARSSFEKADLKGALLSQADASEASFEGADLTGADLAGAKLDKARFTRASIGRADFTGASAEEARFDGVIGDKPQLAHMKLRSALFEGAALTGADFSGAKIDGAVFTGATLTDVRLYSAEGSGVSFDRAKLEGARCDGVKLLRSTLQKLEAPSTVWERAVLNESTFQGANLKGASFNRATCLKAVFSGAEMSEARCRRAKMMGAAFTGANLMSATFERADLTLADLRGANLHTAETWRATLDHAKLDQAIVTQSKLKERK